MCLLRPRELSPVCVVEFVDFGETPFLYHEGGDFVDGGGENTGTVEEIVAHFWRSDALLRATSFVSGG